MGRLIGGISGVVTHHINWDGDWSDCYEMLPKKSRLRWCNACKEHHDIGLFFRVKGRWLKCCLNPANRSYCMAKIKGGAGAGGKK